MDEDGESCPRLCTGASRAQKPVPNAEGRCGDARACGGGNPAEHSSPEGREAGGSRGRGRSFRQRRRQGSSRLWGGWGRAATPAVLVGAGSAGRGSSAPSRGPAGRAPRARPAASGPLTAPADLGSGSGGPRDHAITPAAPYLGLGAAEGLGAGNLRTLVSRREQAPA